MWRYPKKKQEKNEQIETKEELLKEKIDTLLSEKNIDTKVDVRKAFHKAKNFKKIYFSMHKVAFVNIVASRL